MSPSRFKFQETDLAGLKVVERKLLEDHRGYFSRLFCAEEFSGEGFPATINQINQTCTRQRGAVRGLHFQHPPHAEIKMVSCLKGRIFDVAVDLRKGSPTFLQWRGALLSEENHTGLLIPQGFAHGFQTLEENCELLYLHSSPYHPEVEDGLHPADPRLGITWPLEIADLSDRDKAHPFILEDYQGIPS